MDFDETKKGNEHFLNSLVLVLGDYRNKNKIEEVHKIR